MRLVYIQVAGGLGAQILSCLAISALKDAVVFKDGRYFRDDGRRTIPEGITYFDKSICDRFLRFNYFEKSRLLCGILSRILRVMSQYSDQIIFLDDDNHKKLAYACDSDDEALRCALKAKLFDTLNDDGASPSCVAHIRRGDYLSAGLPTIDLANLDNRLRDDGRSLNTFTCITDSVDLVEEECTTLHLKPEVVCGSVLRDLSVMSNSEVFVASDSQLSLAALLLSDTIQAAYLPNRWSKLGLVELLAKRRNLSKIELI